MNNKLNELKEILAKARKYQHAINIMYFDFETIAPKDGMESENDTINYFSNEYFKLIHNDKVNNLIVDLYKEKDNLEYLDKLLIEKLHYGYIKTKNITPEFNLKMNQIYSNAYIKWLDAKEKKDYNLFKDSLKEVINIQKEEISLRENKLPNVYDNMLNDCEKGVLTKDLDPYFNELKLGLIELLNKIKNSNHKIRTDFLNRKVPVYKQELFSKYLIVSLIILLIL